MVAAESMESEAQSRVDAAWATLREEQRRMDEQLQLLAEKRPQQGVTWGVTAEESEPVDAITGREAKCFASKRSSFELRA